MVRNRPQRLLNWGTVGAESPVGVVLDEARGGEPEEMVRVIR